MASELTIVQTTLNDRGEYSCIANNAYGHDHAAINVQVQEPPTFPRNLHVTELGSRSVFLSWSPGDLQGTDQTNRVFNGDSQPVANYILQYKDAQDVWHEMNSQTVISGDKTFAIVQSLKPATNYHFRLYAENHLGTSAPSDILHVQTDAEVPGGQPQQVTVEPLGPQQLLVTWRPPDRELWHGELLGYTIGYHRIESSEKNYNYTRIGIPGGEGVNDFRLTGLDKYTQYSVTVQAFNAKGDGPASDPVIAHTLEDAPSAPPQQVSCTALTALNIQVSWQVPPIEKTHGIIQGYKILYEPINLETEYSARETKITSALSTVLHGLQPFTNYTVQVLSFTRAGEGVLSSAIICSTDETVPDAPERVKSIVNSQTSAIISWLPPRRPNGIVTKYTVFIRILDKGQEVKIVKDMLLAQSHHYEAKDLNSRDTYEAWVTASTRVGQGPSTPVIKLSPSSVISASIVSFGQTLSVSWRVDVKLACIFVGMPKPTSEWRINENRSTAKHRLEIGNDNTLTLRNVQRAHQGNYTCHVKNTVGSDHIIYQLLVQVPPSPPELLATASSATAVALQWRTEDLGGTPLRGFLLSFRHEYGDWDEQVLDRHSNSYLLENLQCGSKYEFTMTAFNKIGSGNPSNTETVRTKGKKPISPKKQHLIRTNITSVILELSAWQDGGCPILYFTVEFKQHAMSHDFIVVSSNVASQARFPINDLEPATAYNLRITAHNNAGATIAEYLFETLNLGGSLKTPDLLDDTKTNMTTPILRDIHFLTVTLISIVVIIIIMMTVCFCFRHTRNGFNQPPTIHHTNANAAIDGKHGLNPMMHRDQYYATVKKQSGQSPCHDAASQAGLERIPEYSEDIYPYATFHLPDQDNLSSNPGRIGGANNRDDISGGGSGGGCIYDTHDASSITKQQHRQSNQNLNSSGTAKRTRRKSKSFKSESEEYDSLGSDSDDGLEHNSKKTSCNSLENSTAAINYPSNHVMASSPGLRHGKERLAVFTRSTHHNPQFHNNPEFSTSTEKLPISEINSNRILTATATNNSNPSYQNLTNLIDSSAASTHDKFYGEFFTIGPRRKDCRNVSSASIQSGSYKNPNIIETGATSLNESLYTADTLKLTYCAAVVASVKTATNSNANNTTKNFTAYTTTSTISDSETNNKTFLSKTKTFSSVSSTSTSSGPSTSSVLSIQQQSILSASSNPISGSKYSRTQTDFTIAV